MFVIASNLTTRDPKIAGVFKQARVEGWNVRGESAKYLQRIAEECVSCKADALEIDTQQHFDEPGAMKFAVEAVQQVADLQLCLSSNKPETLEAGLKACKKPPVVNYLALEMSRLEEVLPKAVSAGAGLVLLVSDPSSPTDAREMLQKAAILVGAANAEGITNEKIFVDPGVIHITNELGQRHMSEVVEFLKELPRAVDPPVRSTCWLASSSSGAPATKRPVIETAVLHTLAGAGISSVFMDVLRRENRMAVRLARIFQDELVYSDGDIEL
jgi:5-methyltetrahydrofolate--homocysteine methyltransferase